MTTTVASVDWVSANNTVNRSVQLARVSDATILHDDKHSRIIPGWDGYPMIYRASGSP